MNKVNPYLIFSVYRTENSEQVNENAHKTILTTLKSSGIEYSEVEGVYNGTKELSIAVSTSYEPLVLFICRQYTQECYLKVCSDLSTFLVYPDKESHIGTMRQITEQHALESQCYTKYNGKYFNAG